jgi:hypothetical protein
MKRNLSMKSRSDPQQLQDLYRTIVDMDDTSICVIDDRGDIVLVNNAWRRSAEDASSPATIDTMEKYLLRLCNRVAGESAEGAAFIADGIRSVLRGEREWFNFKYSRHLPTEERWFEGSARRIEHDGTAMALVTHGKINAQPRM